MARRKRKPAVPVMLLWSKGAQKRFSEAVERMQSLADDLLHTAARLETAAATIAAASSKRSAAARKANQTRRADSNGATPASDQSEGKGTSS